MSAHEPERARPDTRAWEALVLLALWRAGALRRSRAGNRQRASGAGRARIVSHPSAAWGLPPGRSCSRWLRSGCGARGADLRGAVRPRPEHTAAGTEPRRALAALALALIVAGARLVPQETRSSHARSRASVSSRSPRSPTSRARASTGSRGGGCSAGAAGVAGAGLTAAVVIPVVALGPGLEDQLRRTPWRAGRALVDDQGKPILAADVNEGGFLTAFPQGADQENLGSPVVVVRVDPATLGCRRSERAGHRTGSSPTRRSARMRRVRSRCIARRSARRRSHAGRRWCALATTPPSTCSTGAASSSGPPAAAPAAAAEDRRQRRAAGGWAALGPGRSLVVGRSRHEPRRARARRGPDGFLDERLGAARGMRFLMSYVFPDHWSFLLGEIALYSFVVLVATGHLPGAVLRSEHDAGGLSRQLRGAPGRDGLRRVRLDAETLLACLGRPADAPDPPLGGARVRGGDHAAPATDRVHGAFRKPRDINYVIGVTLLAIAILEGFAGYSLPDDCSRGWGWRSRGRSRCRCRSSAARSRPRCGAAGSPARACSSRACTSRTCS